jgi:hypothetical protein
MSFANADWFLLGEPVGMSCGLSAVVCFAVRSL